MTHTVATAYYAARHPATKASATGASKASTASTTTPRHPSSGAASKPPQVVAPSPLDLPTGLPRARVRPLLVRLSPGTAPHARQALEVINPRTQRPMQRAFLLVDQLCKPKDRVRLWLAQVLVHEPGQAADGDSNVVWALEAGGGYVVVKESDARFIRQYGRMWGEDPIAEMAALAAATERPHGNVVPALGCFEGTDGCQGLLYLILPHLPGDELFYLVTDAPGKQGLGEAASRPLVKQVIDGLLHLKHAHGLRHGDVSPENVVVSPDGTQATLIDLGMVERVPSTEGGSVLFEPRPRRGKKQYMAPEIHEERAYDPWAADVWALGAMLYVCWTGCTVYRSPMDPHYLALRQQGGMARLLREREARGATRGLSPEAKDLLMRMLAWDFRLRPSLEEIAAHPWMVEDDDETEGTEEEAAEEDSFLLSASTSLSSLGPVGEGEGASFMEEEAEEAEEAVAVVLPPKKRGNNGRGRGGCPHHGDSDNSWSSLESLHERNNGQQVQQASGAGSAEEGETSDEDGEEEDSRAMPTTPTAGVDFSVFFE